MAHPHYGSDKFIIGLVVLIVIILLVFWYLENHRETAPKTPVHSEPPKQTSHLVSRLKTLTS
jgi:hypothetical protein